MCFAGTAATLSVGLGGTGPFTNRWTFNGNIVGQWRANQRRHDPTLTIANTQPGDAAITSSGQPTASAFRTGSVGALVVQNALGFNGNGAGWTINNGAGPAPVFVGVNSLR